MIIIAHYSPLSVPLDEGILLGLLCQAEESCREVSCIPHVDSFNEKRDNKQCLLDTPRRVTVNNKRLISKCKKPEKKYAYTKAIALLRITKGNNSISIGP